MNLSKLKLFQKRILVFAGIVALFFIVLTFCSKSNNLPNSNDRDNNNPAMQESMIKCTLDWGRLATFPASKTNFTIKTEGSSFTRSFKSSFSLPKEDLEKWINESPGLQDAEINSINDTKKQYNIKPGGNAGFAKVTIDFSLNNVEIYVCWS